MSDARGAARSGADPAGGIWRLVNLALGMSAILALANMLGLLAGLLPAYGLRALLTTASLATVPALTIALGRMATDLWAPACILLLVFRLAGLHRRVGAPKPDPASLLLAVAWLTFAIVVLIDGLSLNMGSVGELLLGALAWLLSAGAVLAGLAAAGLELFALFRYRGPSPAAGVAWPLGGVLFLFAACFLPLVLAPSDPFALAARERSEYKAMCAQAGVRFQERPPSPVRSIAVDWDTAWLHDQPWSRIELDRRGRIVRMEGGPMELRPYPDGMNSWDFIEVREYRDKGAPPAFSHFPRGGTDGISEVDAATADAVAHIDVDKPGEMHKAPREQGAVRYTVTLRDRRSGAVLGVQTYVLDRLNNRACGANAGNVISHAGFIHDAVHR